MREGQDFLGTKKLIIRNKKSCAPENRYRENSRYKIEIEKIKTRYIHISKRSINTDRK